MVVGSPRPVSATPAGSLSLLQADGDKCLVDRRAATHPPGGVHNRVRGGCARRFSVFYVDHFERVQGSLCSAGSCGGGGGGGAKEEQQNGGHSDGEGQPTPDAEARIVSQRQDLSTAAALL